MRIIILQIVPNGDALYGYRIETLEEGAWLNESGVLTENITHAKVFKTHSECRSFAWAHGYIAAGPLELIVALLVVMAAAAMMLGYWGTAYFK